MTQLENLQPFTEQIETIQTTITNFYQTLKNKSTFLLIKLHYILQYLASICQKFKFRA